MAKYYNGYEVTKKEQNRIRLLREIVSDTSKRFYNQSDLVDEYNNHPQNLDKNGHTIDVLPEGNLKQLLTKANIHKIYHPEDIKANPYSKKSIHRCYLCHDFINYDIKKTSFDALLEEVILDYQLSPKKTFLYIKTKICYEKILATKLHQSDYRIYYIDVGYGSLKICGDDKSLNSLEKKLNKAKES